MPGPGRTVGRHDQRAESRELHLFSSGARVNEVEDYSLRGCCAGLPEFGVTMLLDEADGCEGIGRIRLRRVPDASGKGLLSFVQDIVEAGATIRMDGWAGYNRLGKQGYKHDVINLSRTKNSQPSCCLTHIGWRPF